MLLHALLQEVHAQPDSDSILQLPASSRDVPHFAGGAFLLFSRFLIKNSADGSSSTSNFELPVECPSTGQRPCSGTNFRCVTKTGDMGENL